MTEVEYLDEIARYGVFQFRTDNNYSLGDAIDGALYKSRGWAQRKADKLHERDVVPFGGYIVWRMWVKKSEVE